MKGAVGAGDRVGKIIGSAALTGTSKALGELAKISSNKTPITNTQSAFQSLSIINQLPTVVEIWNACSTRNISAGVGIAVVGIHTTGMILKVYGTHLGGVIGSGLGPFGVIGGAIVVGGIISNRVDYYENEFLKNLGIR